MSKVKPKRVIKLVEISRFIKDVVPGMRIVSMDFYQNKQDKKHIIVIRRKPRRLKNGYLRYYFSEIKVIWRKTK